MSVVDRPASAEATPVVVPDAAAIVGLLADGDRRRALAALVLGATTTAEVRAATGLSTRAAVTALHRLVDGELVERTGPAPGDDGYVVLGEAFRRAAAAAAPPRPAPDPTGDVPEDEARVLRTYLRDGRLTRIPAQRAKQRVVLDRLAQDFEVGVHYPERQVNAVLRRYHDDVAALRRYLVDEGFLDRADGEYWRSGGSIPSRAAPPRP
jgi:hypothetical protein